MIEPGTVVLGDFVGAVDSKRRPAVVISTKTYGRTRPDAIVGLITTQNHPLTPSDYVLLDFREASLYAPSTFRTYLWTTRQSRLEVIGRLSDRDWAGVQNAVRNAIQFGPE